MNQHFKRTDPMFVLLSYIVDDDAYCANERPKRSANQIFKLLSVSKIKRTCSLGKIVRRHIEYLTF
jgi:hypothetical protein